MALILMLLFTSGAILLMVTIDTVNQLMNYHVPIASCDQVDMMYSLYCLVVGMKRILELVCV